MLQTDAFIFYLPRELLRTLSFQSGKVLNRNHCHGTLYNYYPILPFTKLKEVQMIFFSVKTYGAKYFQLKTKAWNNYQMYNSVAQSEMKKKRSMQIVNLSVQSATSLYPFRHLPLPHTQGKLSGKINQQCFTALTHSRASRCFGT